MPDGSGSPAAVAAAPAGANAAPPPNAGLEPHDGSVAFVLDGRPAVARPGELVISAAERAGTYVPRFCYHPRMKPVGMCRMCLVEVSGPRGATLQPACFISVTENMEVVTTSEKVKKAQEGVLEFLLVNHPLDCPVCDKGGECPLQDQTFAYGPGETRFVEEKRHFEKPIALSDLVLLDRERCIQCARCTRFADEVAGEPLIDFAGRGERVEVAVFPDRPFSSHFSGNTVQICPVGALTATPYRFSARPWDLDQVESTCTTCAVGCRVAVQSSADRLTRLLGLDADPVNQGWLCDKGRYVFESVNGDEVAAGPQELRAEAPAAQVGEDVDVDLATAGHVATVPAVRGQFEGEVREDREVRTRRLTQPLVRKDGELVAVGWGEALAAAAAGLEAARSEGGPGAVALIGGARSTNEGAYAWTKLAKSVLGTDSVDAQLGDGLPAALVLGLPRATIDEACAARTVLLLAPDLREELPVLYLRLRGAAVERSTRLVELAPTETALTRYAAVSLRVRPGEAPAAVRSLTAGDPMPAHPEGPASTDEDLERARQLLGGEGPGSAPGTGVVVVLGRPSAAEHEGVVATAARALAAALPGARFLPALRRGNVHGALDMGMAPGVLPGRVSLEAGAAWFADAWGAVPENPGLDTPGILASLAARDGVRALVVVGADVVGDFCDRQLATLALDEAGFLVAVAGHPSATTERADVVLPAAVEHERPGTTTNLEGRVSRLGQKLVPPGAAWPDWMIAAELAVELGADLGLTDVAGTWREIERLAPAMDGITLERLQARGAEDGLVAGRPAGAAPRTLPIDPMTTPGVQSAELQGAPPRVGSAETADAELGEVGGDASEGTAPKPAAGSGLADAIDALEDPHVAPADSYSLRLVSGRRLYDGGSAVAHSPSLLALIEPACLRANPYDLDRLGVATGDPVRVRSARGALVVRARAEPEVARGVVVLDVNVPAAVVDDAPPSALSAEAGSATPAPGAGNLIDAGAAVTDVRLESVR